MGKAFAATSATLILLVSLFLSGCGARTGGAVPLTDADSDINSQYPSAGGAAGGDILPGLGSPSDTSTTPGLPNAGAPSDANVGGTNAPQGQSLTDTGNQFASAWQNMFNSVGSFDPRQVPDVAKTAFNNFMCAMRAKGLFQVVASQMTLPEYVASLYINVLKRAPESASAIDGHAQNILNNGTRAGVRGFLLSDEALENAIKSNFKYFFGPNRAVSAAEMTKWKTYLKQHQDNPGGSVTMEKFQANLAGSAEWYRVRAKSNQRTFVVRLYQYILGRQPSELEIAYWQLGRNYGNQATRTSVAQQFLESDEYRLAKIGQMIRQYWARPVTGDELAFRLQGMKNGRDFFITKTDILTAPQYFERVHLVWNPFAAFAENGQCGQ